MWEKGRYQLKNTTFTCKMNIYKRHVQQCDYSCNNITYIVHLKFAKIIHFKCSHHTHTHTHTQMVTMGDDGYVNLFHYGNHFFMYAYIKASALYTLSMYNFYLSN